MFYYKYFTLNKMKEVHIMSKKILKRSLALGALMAFVITGSVWAGETIELSTGAVIELPTISDYSKSIPDDKKNVYGSIFNFNSSIKASAGTFLTIAYDDENFTSEAGV